MRHGIRTLSSTTSLQFSQRSATAAPRRIGPRELTHRFGRTSAARKLVTDLVGSCQLHHCDEMPVASVVAVNRPLSAGQLAIYREGIDDADAVVAEALAQGASGILTERLLAAPLPQCVVPDAENAAAMIERYRTARPETRTLTIGIVGDGGKTTTTLMVAKLLRDSGLKTAYRTNLGWCDGGNQTVPDEAPVGGRSLVHFLNDAAEGGCQVSVLEINADAACDGRYECCEFDLLIVTSPPPRSTTGGGGDDRGGFRRQEMALAAVASRLAGDGVVIHAVSDTVTTDCVEAIEAASVTYGDVGADVQIDTLDDGGGLATFVLAGTEGSAVLQTAMTGGENAMNLAAAASVGLLLDQPIHDIAESLGSLRSVPGNDERVCRGGHAAVITDGSVTADGLRRHLRRLEDDPSCRRAWLVVDVTAVDADALPVLGGVAERLGRRVILTGGESTKSMFLTNAHRWLDGVRRAADCRLIADPGAAVRWAVEHAGSDDAVLYLPGRPSGTCRRSRQAIRQRRRWVDAAVEYAAGDEPDAASLKLFRPE